MSRQDYFSLKKTPKFDLQCFYNNFYNSRYLKSAPILPAGRLIKASRYKVLRELCIV
jgi:hypothetical protein